MKPHEIVKFAKRPKPTYQQVTQERLVHILKTSQEGNEISLYHRGKYYIDRHSKIRVRLFDLPERIQEQVMEELGHWQEEGKLYERIEKKNN